MSKGAMIAMMVMTLVVAAHSLQGVNIDFYSDGVIKPGEVYDRVGVYDTPPLHTTVDIYGGISDHLLTYDSSTVNLWRDYSGAGSVQGRISLYNSSTLNFRGGVWHANVARPLLAHDSSTVNVYDGHVGLMSTANFEILDTSTVNIYGGSHVAPHVTYGFSTINIYGGAVNTLGVGGSSTANIYGGEIGAQYGFGVGDSAVANIYGYDFHYDPQAKWQPRGWISKLTGSGPDGTPIIIWEIPDPYTSPNINLIPEPCTVSLLALGSLALLTKRQRRKVYSK